jgi:hypothetical protein
MSAPRSPYKTEQEQALMTEIWSPRVSDNPLNFVMFCFPWGKPNTPLENEPGPRKWQREKLLKIKEHIDNQNFKELNDELLDLFQDATVSGRGVGKSALVAWLILWFMSTKLGSTSIITANTEAQLKTKTWAEVGRWHTLAINSHWFERSAMALKPAPWFESLIKDQLKIDTGYYYAQAILWSEENPDAFAGAHNPLGMLLIFDEASGIPAKIWSVSKGFFTEVKCKYRFWFVFSNPRRNTGAFFECFHKNRAFWRNTHIDARQVEGTDKRLYDDIIAEYGEESDEARIEVKGEFPRRGDRQFISREAVEGAVSRPQLRDEHAALVMGIDPARFGDDSTRFAFRQGRDARSIPSVKLKGLDNMEVVAEAVKWIEKVNPDAVFVDAGNGTGIIDRLRELKFTVHEVWFGSEPDDKQWADKRTEMWANVRGWLNEGCIPDDTELRDDLTGPEYEFVGGGDRLKLESKEKMKKRGLSSPDFGDALALTFTKKVARRDLIAMRKNTGRVSRQAKDTDYPIFS